MSDIGWWLVSFAVGWFAGRYLMRRAFGRRRK